MLSNIKRLLKTTPLYYPYRRYTQRKLRRSLISQIGEWTTSDQHHKEFYSEFVKSGDVVFDVGANLGNRSKVFLALEAQTIGFEPQPFCQDILRSALAHHRLYHLEACALGSERGEAKMFVSEAHTISSMSPEWISDVKKSGRFSSCNWSQEIVVPIDTLDNMITKYGAPDFVKIDVEGFEHMVRRGLSQPVKALSMEFVPEHLVSTIECVDKLAQLGGAEFRYSFWDHMEWGMESWVDAGEVKAKLTSLGPETWGDLYARFR